MAECIHPITTPHILIRLISMDLKDFFPFSVVFSLFISILSHAFPKYVSGINFRYVACNSSLDCGRLGKIQYPFWVNGSQPQYCGHPSFELQCLKDEAIIWISPEPFHVIDIDTRTQTLKIARFHDPSTGNITCPYSNISKGSITTFSYTSDVRIIRVLHNCPLIKDLSSYEYPCSLVNNNNAHSYFVANEPLANRFISSCGYSALLHVLRSDAEGLVNRSLKVGEALSKGFEVRWTTNETQCKECMESDGRCGYDPNFNTPSCFCLDKSNDRQTCLSSMHLSSSNDFYPSFFLSLFFYYYIKTSAEIHLIHDFLSFLLNYLDAHNSILQTY